jgi:hypothetical protein
MNKDYYRGKNKARKQEKAREAARVAVEIPLLVNEVIG